MTPELRAALMQESIYHAMIERDTWYYVVNSIAPLIDAAIADASRRADNTVSIFAFEAGARDALLAAAHDMSKEAALSYLNGRIGTSGAQYDFATWLRNRANGATQ